jgi:N-methylhydantoinase A
VEISRDLGIPRVVIPNLPAHFSALGMLLTDVRHDFVRTCYGLLLEANAEELLGIFAELAVSGHQAIDGADIDPANRLLSYAMDLRYVGQEFTLQVPLAEDELMQGDLTAIRHRFDALHEQRFDHASPEEPVELVNLRLTARGLRPKLSLPTVSKATANARIGERAIILMDAARATSRCAVYRRDLLAAGERIAGPCAIEELGSTTTLFEDDRAEVAETGEIIVEIARP